MPFNDMRRIVRGLDEFFESSLCVPIREITTGKQWDLNELNRKSFEDLHKLWYIVSKERNMLETQKLECKRLNVQFLHKSRLEMVFF